MRAFFISSKQPPFLQWKVAGESSAQNCALSPVKSDWRCPHEYRAKRIDPESAKFRLWICHRCGGSWTYEKSGISLLPQESPLRKFVRISSRRIPERESLPLLQKTTQAVARSEESQILLRFLPPEMVECTFRSDQPKGHLLLHLRPLRKNVHGKREPASEVLLPRLLYCRPLQG